MIHLFRTPAFSKAKKNDLLSAVREKISSDIEDISTEYCFNIDSSDFLHADEMKLLTWLLSETFEPDGFSTESFLTHHASRVTHHGLLEVGPRMNFTTAWSTNAVSVCHACGLKKINRIERSRRFLFVFSNSNKDIESLFSPLVTRHSSLFYDKMTECPYPEPLTTFETGIKPEPVFDIPLKEEGKAALQKINREMGLGLDDWDIDYYYNLFVKDIGRNPTNVECFDLSQSNSEHSRHWFFKGLLQINGEEIPHTLIELVMRPLKWKPANSVIAFNDNSSSIKGYEIDSLTPEDPGKPSRFRKEKVNHDIIFTAETHNFPSGVAPFPGAETGTGGRLRDIQGTGRGGLVGAGTAAYCVGNLHIPGYDLPWEDKEFIYPSNLASPLKIETDASNGASDYGNKFGEPLIQGYTRSFGMRISNGERYEWLKPIMFTGGIGQMNAEHVKKGEPAKGMCVVKIGGPAYRIGIGGGAASSMIQGENLEELDFNAVQRGDAEMEQKVDRVLRACIELGGRNPIVSIHDQGAGGNCNVVKEIIYPAGAKIDVRKILSGDDTLSVLEIWGGEYQELDALLLNKDDVALFDSMCSREKVPYSVIGDITGDGRIVLYDELDESTPVDLDLEKVLGDMPQKTFEMKRFPSETSPLKLPEDISIKDALNRVLKLVSVGSKRFLTTKVDRSVSGLIAQQQCAGPLHLTVSDVAVIAQSHLGTTGAASSIGEQPIKGLINPAAMARISVGEALTNMVWAKVSALEDVKCSGNWMWAAKLPGEGARLHDAAHAMSDFMIKLGIAVDGGKDSLSMAAQVTGPDGSRETVKSPGTLVISAYATMPDITKVITPDIKKPGQSRLMLINLGYGNYRLGGSALAQAYGQLGSDVPDVNPVTLKRAFKAVQSYIEKGIILAGHDRSDGGLITTLLEMAFAGNCGIDIELKINKEEAIAALFSEDLGLVIEYMPEDEDEITALLDEEDVHFSLIGGTTKEKQIVVDVIAGNNSDEAALKGEILSSTQNDKNISSVKYNLLSEDMRELREIWEETSHRLDRLQATPACVDEEKKAIFDRIGPDYKLSFTPEDTPAEILDRKDKYKVAIIREEGSNSDREMTAAFYQAGFEPWDISMTDLLEDKVKLADFRGIAFVGGFSYADVLDSAKGWAGVIRFNKRVWQDFRDFYNREDTFSLGVCNGCQLMALLGWVPWQGIENDIQPRFIHNTSGRFESRFSSVKIQPGNSIMLQGMDNSVLGVWVAHGEGRAFFPDEEIMKKVDTEGLAPLRYVDDANDTTMTYPFNPNGSALGIAGLCSPDGRHLAMMPHPERTFLKWHWPWMPEEWKDKFEASPWLKMFQNAREWCEKQIMES